MEASLAGIGRLVDGWLSAEAGRNHRSCDWRPLARVLPDEPKVSVKPMNQFETDGPMLIEWAILAALVIVVTMLVYAKAC